ncbi:MAG: hypothetical protein COA32_08735 [Fluviicola sp.]|nr:MAG: hypothetical protein COA32_08735 [Fluviicola sp.]
MNKLILIIITLVFFINVSGQTFSKKDFVKTDWFTENNDSLFFVSDTIQLIQYTNYGSESAKGQYAEYEMKYFDHGDYLKFSFKRFGQFKYRGTYNNYKNFVPIAEFTWKFDKRKQVLKVFKEKQLQFKLKPISNEQIKIESRFAGQDLLTTNKLTLLKIE